MGCIPCTNMQRTHHLRESLAFANQPPNCTKNEELRFEPGVFVGLRRGNLRDSYILGRKLGAGAFGFVREAIHKISGQRRAVKTIHKDNLSRDMTEKAKFFTEVDILSRADHPNIVKLYEFYEDEKYFHLITEFVGGGELFDYIIKTKMLSEPIAAHFMKQILSGVAYCHSNNIVHRDIKPENLLLDKEEPDAILKIIDFGTSGTIAGRLTQKYGTAYYIAPEVLRQDYDEKCDVWSCGVILFILLSGRPPFYGRGDKEILSRVEKGEYSLKGCEWDNISAACKTLIRKLLEYNPRKRITAKEALEDEWLSRYSGNISSMPIALDNLFTFRAERKLQKAVLAFIASQFITKEESEKLIISFRKIDKNNDGKLSREELLEAYSQIYLDESASEVDKLFEQVDINKSGYIDYSEFLTAFAAKENLLNSKNLDSAFKVFDADGNGKISSTELKALLGSSTTNSSNEIWDELIREVDQNGDGSLDISEFKDMMLRLPLTKF